MNHSIKRTSWDNTCTYILIFFLIYFCVLNEFSTTILSILFYFWSSGDRTQDGTYEANALPLSYTPRYLKFYTWKCLDISTSCLIQSIQYYSTDKAREEEEQKYMLYCQKPLLPWFVIKQSINCDCTHSNSTPHTLFLYTKGRMGRVQILKINCIILGYKRLFLSRYIMHWKLRPCSTPYSTPLSHLSTCPTFLMFPQTHFSFGVIYAHMTSYQYIQIYGSQRRRNNIFSMTHLIVPN